MCVGLYLGSLSHSTDPCVCFSANTIMFSLLLLCITTKSEGLKLGSVILPGFYFFVKIFLAILGLLWFPINFRIICSSSVKNVMGILIGIALNLYIVLGSMTILAILVLPFQEQVIIFPFLSVIFSHLSQNFIVFIL